MKLVSDQVSEQEMAVIIRELKKALNATSDGSVVEFGCYAGTTSLFLQETLIKENAGRELYVYDSFQSLPEKLPQDNSPAGMHFKEGELLATQQQLRQNFKKRICNFLLCTKDGFQVCLMQMFQIQ